MILMRGMVAVKKVSAENKSASGLYLASSDNSSAVTKCVVVNLGLEGLNPYTGNLIHWDVAVDDVVMAMLGRMHELTTDDGETLYVGPQDAILCVLND